MSAKNPQCVAFDYGINSLREQVVFSQTSGGIKFAALNKPLQSDLVQMNLSFKFGSLSALQNQSTAGAMAGAVVQRGTSASSRQQIRCELLRLGVVVSMGFNETGGTAMVTAKNAAWKSALDFVAHLLKDSNFPEEEFEEIRSARIKAVESQIRNKSAQADNAWSRYGNQYAKGDPRYRYTLEETLQELKAVTRNQASTFFRQFYGAQNAQVTLLGPIDAQEIQQALASLLDGWRAPEPWQRIERPLTEMPPARLVFDTPGRTVVALRAFNRLPVSSMGMDSDYLALVVASRIFGGGPGSRMWVRLREANGPRHTVSAGLNASPYERSGSIFLHAEVAHQNVAVAEQALREELARSLIAGFAAAEVETFKRQILADRLRGRCGDGWAMSFMSSELEFAQATDATAQRDALIASFTPRHINAVWRQYLRPHQLVWGVFGDLAKVR